MSSHSEDEDGVPCKTPSPRSSASQAPPNPRHNLDEPPPRINLYTVAPPQTSHPFKGLSRKFMSRKDHINDHKRGRSEGSKLNIGPPLGVYDTPNVRERVRRWQQSGGGVVLPGDVVELPPISPATPTPGIRRGMPLMPGMDMSLNGIASTMHSDSNLPPLKPPRMPALRDEWDSASECEKEAERQRTRSLERERKLRRRDRDSSTKTGMPEKANRIESSRGTPVRDQTNSPAASSYFEEDGIRIIPIKSKRLSSENKRKKREKSTKGTLADETDDGGVNLASPKIVDQVMGKEKQAKKDGPDSKTSTPVPPQRRDLDDGIGVKPIKSTDKKSTRKPENSQAPEVAPTESETRESPESSQVRVDTWDYEDGVRIYATKPKTPVKLSERHKSVRKSAKSVQSRKEKFEAGMKHEAAAQKAFNELVQEHDDADDEGKELIQISKEMKTALEETEGGTAVGASQFSKNRWASGDDGDDGDDGDCIGERPLVTDSTQTKYEDFDIGIRVRPLKTRTTRRKKSPESLAKARSKRIHRADSENTISTSTPIDGKQYQSSGITSSAPATPTGTRLRPDTLSQSPFSDKQNIQALDNESDYSSTLSSRKLNKRERINGVALDFSGQNECPTSEGTENRQRPNRNPSFNSPRNREERRAERKELRRQLREESEMFKTLVAVTPTLSPQLTTNLKDIAVPPAREKTQDQSQIPSQPKRERKGTLEDKLGPSIEDHSVRQGAAIAPSTPVSSVDSLSTKKGHSHDNKAPTTTEDPGERHKSVASAFSSESPVKSGSAQKEVAPLDELKSPSWKKETAFAPKLTLAAGSILKAVKEEFSGKSVRLDDAKLNTVGESGEQVPSIAKGGPQKTVRIELDNIEDDSTTDSSVSESESEHEIIETPIPIETKVDSQEAPLDEKRKQAPQRLSTGHADRSVQMPIRKAMGCVEEPVKRSVKELVEKLEKQPAKRDIKSDDSETIGQVAKNPSADNIQKKETANKTPEISRSTSHISDAVKLETATVKASTDMPADANKTTTDEISNGIAHTQVSTSVVESNVESMKGQINQASSNRIVSELVPLLPKIVDGNTKPTILQEVPESTRPRRSLRSTTAPPRPKSIHSRTGSDGSLTPTASLCGDELSRTISNASTVKPLRFKKAGQQNIAEAQKPLEHNAATKSKTDKTVDRYNSDLLVRLPSLKRKYTKHTDLISILSVPKSNKSLRSAARSRRRKGRKRVETLTIGDLLEELKTEEVKYMHELRTLVEDVVPVLFQTVLGRADDDLRRTSSISSIATSTTGSSRASRSGFSSNPTRPIVDMGISLERLKSLHERIPSQDDDHLLTWATDAKRVYEEYLSVWRMGFQDVVVSMSPDEEQQRIERDESIRKELELLHGSVKGDSIAGALTGDEKYEGDPSTWAMPPPPDMEDDIEDEKVDVAFLLKRPLVRLKTLAKLFKRIDYMKASPLAASLSSSFHTLVVMARRKVSEEKARIEDEAAASLDVSRVHDIHLLLPRRDVILDQKRRVKARDSFAMRLYHSSDEIIERNIELIFRDPSTRSRYSESEVLIVSVCQQSTKWLLFAPVPLSAISAKTGDAAGEIIVMVRGTDKYLNEWREVMVLASSTAAGFEWVQMLGLVPIPPDCPFSREPMQPAVLETVIEESIAPSRHHTPVQPTRRLRTRNTKISDRKSPGKETNNEKVAQDLTNESATNTELPLKGSATAKKHVASNARASPAQFVLPEDIWLPPGFSMALLEPPEICNLTGGSFEIPDVNLDSPGSTIDMAEIALLRSPSLHTLHTLPEHSPEPSIKRSRRADRRSKSMCERDEPKPSSSVDIKDSENSLDRSGSVHLDEERPNCSASQRLGLNMMDGIPVLSPTVSNTSPDKHNADPDAPPPVPPHRTPTTVRLGSPKTPLVMPLIPTYPASSAKPGFSGRRRTSSPLKHEYDPSSPSNSDSEYVDAQDGDSRSIPSLPSSSSSSSSSSSEDEESDDAVSLCSEEEDGDYPPPMLSIPRRASRLLSSVISVPKRPSSSISPSNDFIEATGAIVKEELTPPSEQLQPRPPLPQIGIKFRAYIFTWATNQWTKLSPDECKIVITPGYIEAFPLSTGSNTSPSSPVTPKGKAEVETNSSEPSESSHESIFSFDLTANLAVRRGTAVDISIKTPASSKLVGASIMLRSRSPNECETLFNAINNNRTHPQNYQLPSTTTVSSPALASSEMDNNESSTANPGNIKRGFAAWAKSKTYRAGPSMSSPSLLSYPSEASVNSISSAFSRFRAGRIFKNPATGSAESSSSSMADGSGDGSSPGQPNVTGIENCNVAMSPMKIRLYRRENASKWRDLGNSRLNVFKPLEGPGPKGRDIDEDDKRVVITNKKGDSILLDVILGESAFERVARTGIAMSVLISEGEEDGTGKPAHVGGIGAKSTVYMMQMKGEAEAAFSFSILGKLRY